MVSEVKKSLRNVILTAFMVLMLAAGCRPASTPTPVVAVDPAATRTLTAQEVHVPTVTPALTKSGVKTPPPMLVLTQPTRQTPLPQVTTTTGISKPALVQIESPGPWSKVRDFIWVRANVYPGDGGNIHLLLTGEDGRVITSRDLVYSNWAGGWLSIAEQLFFTPAAASEKALLSVYTLDWFGRITAWNSVEILLLQLGPEEIEQPGFKSDPFVVSKPQAGSAASGGMLHLEGSVHLTQTGKTSLNLVDQFGSVLVSQELLLPTVSETQGYVPFSVDVPYEVQKRTPVRLILKQTSSEFGSQTFVVSSLILFLDP